jgi:hypothetical protein
VGLDEMEQATEYGVSPFLNLSECFEVQRLIDQYMEKIIYSGINSSFIFEETLEEKLQKESKYRTLFWTI